MLIIDCWTVVGHHLCSNSVLIEPSKLTGVLPGHGCRSCLLFWSLESENDFILYLGRT